MIAAVSRQQARKIPQRLAVFALAVGTGTLAGIAWGASAGPDWAYWGFLQLFVDPRAQIASLGVGLALGFMAGFIHIVRV